MPSSSPPSERRVFDTICDDFRAVWPEVRREGLGPTVGHTFADLGDFYLTNGRLERLAGMGRLKRALWLSGWLFKSLFLKLTPARRVLLILALVALWASRSAGPSEGSGVVIGVALLLVVLALELKDKLLAREELEAGRAVQRALMPDESPAIPGWDVWLFTRPANDVGGDLVDCLSLGEGRWALALADVAGKGLPAALLMAKLQATLRAFAPESRSPADLATRVNRILHRDGPRRSFTTLLYAELAETRGRVNIVNAGHPPALLLRAGSLEALPFGSLALGIVADVAFTPEEVELAGGDLLLIYSDGVSEAMSETAELYGEARLRALLPSLTGLPAREAGSCIVESVRRFTGRARLADDLSLILLRRVG
jgi:phosphoserine phosphatase RsbU/P